METLECKNCGNKTNSKYCPTCGNMLIKKQVRTLQEIETMEELIAKAIKMKGNADKDSGVFEIIIGILMDMTLSWVRGGEHTPVETILQSKNLSDTEQGKALIELSKMGARVKE